jgi:hypothetical protein
MFVNSFPVALPDIEFDLMSPLKTILVLADSILIEPAYVFPLFMSSGVVLSMVLTAETTIVDILDYNHS